MSWSRDELKARAKIAFQANYWKCVLVSFVVALMSAGGVTGSGGLKDSKETFTHFSFPALLALSVTFLVLSLVATAISIFVGGPIEVGGCRFYIENAGTPQTRPNLLGYAFRTNYINVVVVMFLRNLFIFLWSLLFVIPGIIKAYEYRMVPYLLAEDPDLSWEEASRRSSEMMDGHKIDTFVLELSFLGWFLLSAITGGLVGVFYAIPYRDATIAELYMTLCGKRYQSYTDNPYVQNPYSDNPYMQ